MDEKAIYILGGLDWIKSKTLMEVIRIDCQTKEVKALPPMT